MDRTDPVAAELHDRRARGIRTALILAAVVVVLRYLPLTSHLFVFSLVEKYAYDLAFDYRAPAPPSDLVILAIDDYSLQRLGKFPWPREVYADLLDRLPQARVVAFDVLFVEPDRGNALGDQLFAEAMRRHGRVILGAYRQERAEYAPDRGQGLTSYPLSPGGPGPLRPLQPLNFQPPLPLLAQAAAGVGYVDLQPDRDGVHRSVEPLRVGYDRRLYPHFATEIARLASAASPAEIGRDLPRGSLRLGARRLPLNSEGSLLLNYCGPLGTVPTFSFHRAYTGELPPQQFRDKIVLIGATAPGLYDIRPAPFHALSRKFFGVETNANAAATLLHRPPLRDASRAWAWLLFALLLGSLAGWLVWSTGETLGPLLGVLVFAVLAAPSFFVAFFLLGQVIPYGALLLAVGLPVAVGAVERLGAERRMVKRQFATYVSPRVLDELVRHPDLIRRGQRRAVTVLFADVRGSTALAESLPPETWLTQLNEYLTAMSTVILEQDGYLDKFMGDGIMALWNAFGNQPDHADRAVCAGQTMLQALELLNRHWQDLPDRQPLRIGIGIHSGEALIGNVGSDERTQFTAIGDAINTGARLEPMTKEHGVDLLVSEATAALLDGRFPLREIGEVPVRGRTQPIRIYAVEVASLARPAAVGAAPGDPGTDSEVSGDGTV